MSENTEHRSLLSSVSDTVTSFFRRKKTGQKIPPKLGGCLKHPYGPFQFQITSWEGAQYDLQASTNLVNWASIAQGVAPGEVFDYVDSDAHKFSFRFYRLIAEGLHSANVVGFATVSTPPGFAMIANPLNAPDNRVCALFPNLPDGSTFNKFDHVKFRLSNNAFKDGKWLNPDETLVPGEGAIICNPTSEQRVLTFVGEVMQGRLFKVIPAGFSICSSLVPQAGRLHLDLGFPVSPGDVIHIFDRDRQKYVIMEYDEKKWAANPPLIGVGESFWVGKTSAANWVREFYVTL